MLLNGSNHVGLDRRASGAGNDQKIRKTSRHKPEVGARPGGPFVLQRLAARNPNIDIEHGTGHGVITGGEDHCIKLIVVAGGSDAGGRHFGNRVFPDIDQRDVVAIEGFVIAGIETQTLGTDRMIIGHQPLSDFRIHDGLPDLVPHECAGGFIGLLVGQEILVGVKEADVSAGVPLLLEALRAGFFGIFVRILLRRRMTTNTKRRAKGFLAMQPVLALVSLLLLLRQRAIDRRHAEIGGALKHMQMPGLLRNHRDQLNAR